MYKPFVRYRVSIMNELVLGGGSEGTVKSGSDSEVLKPAGLCGGATSGTVGMQMHVCIQVQVPEPK